MTADRPRLIDASQRGAALPLVLVVIALLSFMTATSFTMLERSSAEFTRFVDRGRAEIALRSAEAEATYAYLTGAPTINGLSFPVETGEAPTSLRDQIDATRRSTRRDDEVPVWPGDGSWRRPTFSEPVAISYRDGAGLFPIVGANEPMVALFLRRTGLPRDDAESIAAKIVDYVDADNVRRFRGGERSDYRLQLKPPPTNSPLRAAEELPQVLGFDRVPPAVRDRIRDNATFLVYTQSMKPAVATPLIRPLVEAQESESTLSEFAAGDRFPGLVARFTLAAEAGGAIMLRVVDVQRNIGPSGPPLERLIVSERIVPVDADAVDPTGMDFAVVDLYRNDPGVTGGQAAYALEPIFAAESASVNP